MAFIFWVIVIVLIVFGGISYKVPALASYTWVPILVLFVLLGLHDFGFPH